jgi:hypothetical protein
MPSAIEIHATDLLSWAFRMRYSTDRPQRIEQQYLMHSMSALGSMDRF